MGTRGVSTTVGYVATLGIATVLVTGLLIAGVGFVDGTRDQVLRQELEVVGQHVAMNVEAADRLAVAGNDTETVMINETFPGDATGTTYRVSLVTDNGGQLHVNTTNPDASVAIDIENETALAESSANGGEIAVVYDPATDQLVIQNA